ncbi:PLP-dependent aminotransferase family protein [Celeribacter sp.]|uniref:MocR-like pyridoxine biosynthesis transcription factor PdxR n=1 Tax=Celeribacter sp. TaxID=1890673 RepID=UPI003A8DD4E1
MREPLALDIELGHSGPLFLAIAEAITHDITRGRLRPGARLPGTRALAQELGVHRNTVDAAYQELLMQGWLEAKPARGTFVAQDLPQGGLVRRTAPDPVAPETPPPALAFTDGAPDPKLVPDKALARAFRRALLSPGFRAGADYGDARGTSVLRQALAGYLASDRGVVADPSSMIITRGSQMALFLAARAALSPGDVIAVEDPGYPLAWEAFGAAGAVVRGVPVDGGGLRIDALEAALARDARIRAVYVTPHHQYPTTVTMGAARRLQLLELAQRHGITLIEDDYDHEYRFEGRPVLPLAARAPDHLPLIYVGSLSKLLSPGIRLGYALASGPVLRRMAEARAAIDRQGDAPLEAALAEVIVDGDLGRHARKARRIYRARRDFLAELLRVQLAGRASFELPGGGLALWLRCDGVAADRWAESAGQAGLALLPGKRFALEGAEPQAFRLGYAALDEDRITRAVEILAKSWPG